MTERSRGLSVQPRMRSAAKRHLIISCPLPFSPPAHRIHPMPEDVTPVRQQYLDIKRDYPDTILFFRLGDFYETFDEDAETAARELDIVLTSRPVGKGMRAPLARIPYPAV